MASTTDPRTEAGEGSNEPTRWLTPEERAAWLAVSALSVKLPSALDGQLQRDAGLSLFEYMVMAVLSEQPDRSLQMSDLANLTSASLSRLSHTAKRLEKAGYLQRDRCPGAGRRTNATLTPAGYDKVVATAPGHVDAVRGLLIDVVSPEQLAVLSDVGAAVVARLGDVRPPR